ncbi:hypothetical protein [Devosia elaeis]|nr:hypothetical protein [Devosia elaeis]
MSSMKSAMVLLACLLLAMPAGAHQAEAVPLEVAAEHLTLRALDQTLALPLPDWTELQGAAPATMLDLVSVHFREADGQARLEIYPRGEGEALWSRLYGANIFAQPGLTLADLRTAMIDVYARTCRPDRVALFQLEPDNGDDIPPLGLVCGAYRDLPGYAGQGEVMIMGFYKSPAGVAAIYQEWRGPAFDPADASTWPVSSAEVETRFGQFKSQAALRPVD